MNREQNINDIIKQGKGLTAVLFNSSITVANVITVSRLLLLPFIIYFIITGQRTTAFIILLISLLSDAVDGYLARRLKQESEIGKYLDPLVDKISLTTVLITLFLIKAIPLWGIIIIVLRDVLILIGSFVLLKHKSKVFKSHVVGKITGVILGAIICSFTLNWNKLGEILLYISIPAIVVSFGIYLKRYISTMKGAE
ncbi:MAG TPA: CDP-alcohol phosphatidyltransferase family protein [candidate division WOR-3 bacterium]|uniref:CDP-alcohol phosphatidyltransferase family protein n=1 Tax=candidate division WOR-3 bacterium TaxID=2052148 RepID=A0A9C9K0S3_UNCW3|nr:CDP-alcohol phosphatidyltransferase family protein [candidate division WOR-3 bacterium]